jgi:hypothetical protein
MSCPFFKPLRLMEWSSGRAPLGGTYHGECDLAQGAEEPRLCNFGYARGLCSHFPEGSAADAVRFSVAGNANGEVRLVWILEKDHAPLDHGVVEYHESTGEFVEGLGGALGVQAKVFLENYLRG